MIYDHIAHCKVRDFFVRVVIWSLLIGSSVTHCNYRSHSRPAILAPVIL